MNLSAFACYLNVYCVCAVVWVFFCSFFDNVMKVNCEPIAFYSYKIWYLTKRSGLCSAKVVVVFRAEQSLKAWPYFTMCRMHGIWSALSKFSKRSLAQLFVTCMNVCVCVCVCIRVYFVACHEQHHLYRAEIVKIIIIEEKNTHSLT